MYNFDPNINAKASLKERFVWMLYMGLMFFLLYGVANQFAGIRAPHPSFSMGWEQAIPFVPIFIIPYMSSDVMFCIAFLFPYNRLELRILAARVLFIVLFSVICFVLFPLSFSFEKPPVQSFTFLFNLLRADLPYNQLPSLHIAFAIVLWCSMRQYLVSILWRIVVAAWLLLIALSTLLVYQHHFLDLPAGAIVGALAVYLVKADRCQWLVNFTTPRSLKMGLYYLIGAAFAIFLAFFVSEWAWLFVYVFCSLFAVSVVYAFGLNSVLAGKGWCAGISRWVLFAPYYIGNYFSWHYYKRRIPLITEVVDGVYLGRFPSQREYETIRRKGVVHAINLAPEQQFQKAKLPETRLPFLDQTIPSPELLCQGVKIIEQYKEQGVYVHCTLGLSRSVLLISAWLLHQKMTLEEIEKLLQAIRPGYVTSAYMKISMDIYSVFLKERRVS